MNKKKITVLHVKSSLIRACLFSITEPELTIDVDKYNRDYMEQSEVIILSAFLVC